VIRLGRWKWRTNLQDMKLQDMTRIDSILFNFSFFLYCDAGVAEMELCNVLMKWIEKKIQWQATRDKSASGVIGASNNTNDINMQH